jgi:multiple sugar transport system substrate-binding protein
MQATYVMAANNDAMQYLPEGANVMALTWDQWRDWGKNINEATGERALGLPLKGGPGAALHHRLLQGYLYPSFTGAVNTEFATESGLAMWDWLKEAWPYINPNATWSNMDLPLQNREVMVAWDHTARLIEALRAEPENFTAFPSPAGPAGRGFMPVIVGLGIPKTASNPEGAKELLKHYLKPETQGLVLEEKGWFPVLSETVPANIDDGLKLQMDAVAAQASADDALPALLPIGLGEQGAAYNFAFQDSMNWVLVQDVPAADYLKNGSGPVLQLTLDRAGAPCWSPDADSGEETCQVGGLE